MQSRIRIVVLGVLSLLLLLLGGAQAAKVTGIWVWGQGRGGLNMEINGSKVTGRFTSGYSTSRPSVPGAINVSGQGWVIQGELDGTYNAQTGDLNATISGAWNYEGMPPGSTSPFPTDNQAPFTGRMSGKLVNSVLSGSWSASVGAASNANAPQPPSSLSGSFSSQVGTRKPQCAEGSFFYSDDVLDGYYTDQPSLNYSRDQMVQEMTAALSKFRAEGGIPQSGVSTLDPINIAQTLATTALPSGKEAALQAAARQLAQSGKKVSPGDFLYLSLKLNGGNVSQALLTAHAALYRDGAKKNRGFIDEGVLKPMRNPAGYANKPVGMGNQQVSARNAVGSDEQGVWYHFFGMAALEFADSKSVTGIAPMFALRFGAETFASGTFADKIKLLKTVPTSGLGGALSDFSIAMENAIRKEGSVPDPDKQCVNFSGVAAGRALANALDLGRDQDQVKVDRQMQGPIAGGSVQIRSPLSLEILGTRGERIAYDQKTGKFSANTVMAFVDAYRENDKTTGLIISPFFTVKSVNFTGSGSGPATIAYYSPASKSTGVYSVTAKPGAKFTLANWTGKPTLTASTPTPTPNSDTTPKPPTPPAQERLLIQTGNIYAVYNNPTKFLRFQIDKPFQITRIVNYHWNGARGKTPGTIALKDASGKIYGPWKAVGSPGQGGVPNAYWTVNPNITLPVGTYTVMDSDPATWAQNPESNGMGFVDLYGYPRP